MDSKMLIVHVANGVRGGGVGTVVRNLLIEQNRAGFGTAVVIKEKDLKAVTQWCEAWSLNTEIYILEKYRSRMATLWGFVSRKRFKQIQKKHPDQKIVYHYHNPISFGLLSCMLPAPRVCTIHGFVGLVSNNRISNWIFKKTIQRMIKNKVRIIGCAEKVAQYYNELFGANTADTIVNGVLDAEKITNKHIADNGKIHIGFASWIDELKGWRILAEAFATLPPEDRARCDLYLAGYDIDKDALEAFVESHEDVIYLGKINDVQQGFLPYVDIMALPSRTEGMPMIILEALQAGTCIVCTPVGGIPEVVEDGVSGWFIERTVENLRSKLSFLIQNPDIREKTRKQAYEQYQKVGSSAVMAQKYLKVYREISPDK